MATLQRTKAHIRTQKRWGVRFIAVFYLTALMTFASPSTSTNTPTLEPTLARADSLNPKDMGWLIAHYEFGYNKTQFGCLARLWGKESAWNHLADNPVSTAFGIAQMLNETSKDPLVQIRNGLEYISHRYKNACNAWKHWQKRNWY